MISNMRRYKNIIGEATREVELGLSQKYGFRDGDSWSEVTSYYVKPLYGMKIEAIVIVPIKGNIIAVESGDGRVYIGIDGSRSKLRFFPHRSYNMQKNPAMDTDFEVQDCIEQHAGHCIWNGSDPKKEPLYQEFLDDISPFSIDDAKKTSGKLKNTPAYKRLSSAFREMADKGTAEVVHDSGTFTKIPNKTLIPVAWIDFTKTTFNIWKDEWARTDKSKTWPNELTSEMIHFMCGRQYLNIPRSLFSIKGTAPYFGDFSTAW